MRQTGMFILNKPGRKELKRSNSMKENAKAGWGSDLWFLVSSLAGQQQVSEMDLVHGNVD